MFPRFISHCAIPFFLVSLLSAQTPPQSNLQSQLEWQRFSTPRKTINNFIYWQNHDRPEIAAQAMNSDTTLTLEERIKIAQMLKRSLDARGMFVTMAKYSDEPDFVDKLTGVQEVVLFEQIPQISLRKYNNQWLFTPQSIQAIPEFYSSTFSTVVEKMLQDLPGWLQASFAGFALWQLLGLFLILLIGFLLRKIVEFFLEKFASRLQKHTKMSWDELIIQSAAKPIGLLVLATFYLSAYTNLQLGVTLNQYIRIILIVLVYSSVIWMIYRLIDVLETYLTRITSRTESKLDDQLVPLIRKSLKVFVVIMGAIFILQNLEVDVASLLAGLGIGGLAVALAARDTLANFFGSITIFIDKPFQVGDWVITGDIEGTVEEVGFRSTRIRTFYNSLVSVPNAKIADSAVDNMGMREFRRLKAYLGLTYSTTAEQMQAFVEGIRTIVQANPHTRKDYYEIHFNSFGDYSLNVLVYVFFKVPSWSDELRERHNLLLEILRLAEKIGVEFAFPTQTLHLDSMPEKTPRQVGKDLSNEEMAKMIAAFGPKGKLAQPAGPKLGLKRKD
ncbi:mechanosensitive ion channel family protein [candidate division KSB1 bacterium]|nr:mechanosensitive ion channel family protein [candidate division KSB1 bacterium]